MLNFKPNVLDLDGAKIIDRVRNMTDEEKKEESAKMYMEEETIHELLALAEQIISSDKWDGDWHLSLSPEEVVRRIRAGESLIDE